MILYHGTNQDFSVININKSRPNKDFGKGFYLTPDKNQALKMAEHKSNLEDGFPIVKKYLFDDSPNSIADLKILSFDSYSEEWVRFILLNRTNPAPKPAHNYDIVIGPIADDAVGVQLFRYLNNYIGIKELIDNLKFHRLTIQYYFGTQRAITHLIEL